MIIEFTIDNMQHRIDSTDPELIGKWFVEILARVRHWTPATYTRIQVWPSWIYDDNGRGRPDWIADTRVLNTIYNVKTPQQFLDALQEQIRRQDELVNNS